MERKVRRYDGDGITVEFEPSRCIHAAECVRSLSAVFDPDARPWIRPGNADADTIASVVRRCPSGALHYRRPDAHETPATANTIRIMPDGPLYVTGRIRLHLPGGEVRDETRVALCRCGLSSNKPFCDNSHRTTGFTDPGRVAEHRFGTSREDTGGVLDVRLAPTGPILIEGLVRVVPSEGPAGEGGKCALCRCGGSGSKPYCDGTHARIGFSPE